VYWRDPKMMWEEIHDIDDGADAINAAVAGCGFIRSSGWVGRLSGEIMEATST